MPQKSTVKIPFDEHVHVVTKMLKMFTSKFSSRCLWEGVIGLSRSKTFTADCIRRRQPITVGGPCTALTVWLSDRNGLSKQRLVCVFLIRTRPNRSRGLLNIWRLRLWSQPGARASSDRRPFRGVGDAYDTWQRRVWRPIATLLIRHNKRRLIGTDWRRAVRLLRVASAHLSQLLAPSGRPYAPRMLSGPRRRGNSAW